MDDPILTEAPPQPPQAPPQPPQADARLDRLEQAMVQLSQTVESAANRLTNQPLAQPAKTADEFMTDLASDPQGVIRREAADAARQLTNQVMGPQVMRVIETANLQQTQGHQAQIDAEFGEGTWADLYKPAMDRDFAQLRQINPSALADPETIKALVDRTTGQHMQDLMDRRKNLEKTAQVRGLSHLLPTGGVPRLRVGNPQEELPPDVHEFLDNLERQTGERVDKSTYTKDFHTGQDLGHGRHRTSLQDYLDVRKTDKATKDKYGCS